MSNENLNLLDETLDDLEDLPEFKVFPNGAHRVIISLENKDINDVPYRVINMRAVETVELADSSDEPLNLGDIGSVMFNRTNEFGRGAFKKVAQVLGAHHGLKNIQEIMEASEGLECLVVTKQKKGKNSDAVFLNLVSLEVI